jgi:NTE family protein
MPGSSKDMGGAGSGASGAGDDGRQVVLVLQGGGALGAYQVGVYHALHDAGIEPHWVIGTSIGAINGAIIAGNPPERRIERLAAFWDRVMARDPLAAAAALWPGLGNAAANLATFTRGVPSFFRPNPTAWMGSKVHLGIEKAAYYLTDELQVTLQELVDFDYLAARHNRLTVGAVNVRTGLMRYFDSREEPLNALHIMASGALPPAFPAVRIDGDPYWDGGIYSNTPIEAVLDDKPRRDSIIFSAQMWSPRGPEPGNLWDVMGRMKDIQYSSRAINHIERQKQLHRLRHVIRQMADGLTPEQREDPDFRALAAWGCGTTMHVVKLNAPHLAGEDHTKDIDFTPAGVSARREAGYAQTKEAIEARPWLCEVDEIEGVMVHEIGLAKASVPV